MFDVCIRYQNDGKFMVSLISNHHRRNPSNCNDAFGHDHNYRIWISSISIVAPPVLQKILELVRYEINIVSKQHCWRKQLFGEFCIFQFLPISAKKPILSTKQLSTQTIIITFQ